MQLARDQNRYNAHAESPQPSDTHVTPSPFQERLDQQGFLILDGGLATELEMRGYQLGDQLWSARLIRDSPRAILTTHQSYLEAGSDCIISASYQATVEGFEHLGFTHKESVALIEKATTIALEAREGHDALVAASIGPYGAFLANGSEYTGRYELDQKSLRAWHAERFHVLAQSGADLLACETIPNLDEARALADLLDQTLTTAWFSFCCRDGKHLSDGTELELVLSELDAHPQITAVGVNCTAPRYLDELIERARSATSKPIVVYPNSGETYDPKSQGWKGTRDPNHFAEASMRWHQLGARVLGGCCRTGPAHIWALRANLTATV